MSQILALWATPRSTSTAFERVMANRGDMVCFHEPYNEAYYYGIDRRHDRYFIADPKLQTAPDLSFASVHEKLTMLAERESVFIKDFAYSITHLADNRFLQSFRHTFLIRNPEKILTSMHARWPDIILPEIGLHELYTLFQRIAERDAKAPPLIDSDELLKSPREAMEAYCNAVGIPYIAEAMQWRKQDTNPTWNTDDHGFHDALKQSTGLAEQPRSYPPLESSADMMRMYEALKPLYDELHRYRIPIEAPS